ncbi:MAG: acetylesterase, partial [Lachnospiraceae bacterium]|nr:acetylesterase [Lachnospiraceae bacterium]
IPRIYLACGHDDYLIEGNRDYADFLKKENADYLFDEGPGIHSWEFWAEYLDRGLLYLLDK